jgi:hypothetical protein
MTTEQYRPWFEVMLPCGDSVTTFTRYDSEGGPQYWEKLKEEACKVCHRQEECNKAQYPDYA